MKCPQPIPALPGARAMANVPPGPDGPEGNEGVPPDFILLLAPDEQVSERVDRDDFLAFAEAALAMVADHCAHLPTPLDGLQVGCALLPGGRLLVEVQTAPAEARPVHARALTRALRRLSVPAVEGGPVAFARRARLGQAAGDLSLPFAS